MDCVPFDPDKMVMKDGVAFWKDDMTTLPTDKSIRKAMPMKAGLLDYFPRALAYVAHVSYIANEQHNPGEPLHWSKEKSADHGDTIIRHLAEAGGKDEDDNLLHSGKLAWRGLALLETELGKLSPTEFENLVRNAVTKLEQKKSPSPSSRLAIPSEKRKALPGYDYYWILKSVNGDKVTIESSHKGDEFIEDLSHWLKRELL